MSTKFMLDKGSNPLGAAIEENKLTSSLGPRLSAVSCYSPVC